MAVGIRIKLLGITEEQFDKGHDQINPDRTPPKGRKPWSLLSLLRLRASFA